VVLFLTCTIALNSFIIESCFSFLLNTGPRVKGPKTISEISVGAQKFSNVRLTCPIGWDPDDFFCPEYQEWSLPGKGTKYIESLEDTGSKCKKELVLFIFDVTENDEGTYTCDFFCTYRGTTKAAIDLKVFVPEMKPLTGIVRKLGGQM